MMLIHQIRNRLEITGRNGIGRCSGTDGGAVLVVMLRPRAVVISHGRFNVVVVVLVAVDARRICQENRILLHWKEKKKADKIKKNKKKTKKTDLRRWNLYGSWNYGTDWKWTRTIFRPDSRQRWDPTSKPVDYNRLFVIKTVKFD